MGSRQRPFEMVFVALPNTMESKNIFKLERLLGLVVRVEPKKKGRSTNQCYRCQRFGHAQTRCGCNPRCVKCAGDHHTRDCDRSDPATDPPPKCANCGGEHTASYKGCSAFPKPKSYSQAAGRRAAAPSTQPRTAAAPASQKRDTPAPTPASASTGQISGDKLAQCITTLIPQLGGVCSDPFKVLSVFFSNAELLKSIMS